MEISQVADDCMIVSTRMVDATIDEVFRAWTEPAHLKNWWGPKGFTNSFHEFDLRPGGKWRFTMHGPDKGNYVNECVFVKIDKPNLIAWKRLSNPLFQVVASFEQVPDNKTKVTFRMIFDSAKECETIRKFAPEKNEENFDRLESELKKMRT